jgi:hypothetical protein
MSGYKSRGLNLLRYSFLQWEELIKRGDERLVGTPGVLEYTPDQERVVCPMCGRLLRSISGAHLRLHGLETADEFRELWGLNRTQPLSSPDMSERMRNNALANDFESRVKGSRGDFQHKGAQGTKYRFQGTSNRKARYAEGRLKGETRKGVATKAVNRRLVGVQGTFSVLNASYYFGTAYAGRRVEIVADETTVTAVLEGGTYKRVYVRKPH